jgi:ribosomal protein S19
MAGQVKRFDEHSERWKKAARRKGIDPSRWDHWRKLSAKTRRVTNPTDYATGQSVRTQIRTPLLNAAVARVVAVHNGQRHVAVRPTAVRRNLDHPQAGMTNARLRRIIAMSPVQLAREIDRSLARNYASGERSPYWYNKRG